MIKAFEQAELRMKEATKAAEAGQQELCELLSQFRTFVEGTPKFQVADELRAELRALAGLLGATTAAQKGRRPAVAGAKPKPRDLVVDDVVKFMKAKKATAKSKAISKKDIQAGVLGEGSFKQNHWSAFVVSHLADNGMPTVKKKFYLNK